MRPNEQRSASDWTPELEAELRQLIRIEYINSLRRIELTRCKGKEGFDSHALAKAVARRPGHDGMVVYHCRFCYRWHLGTSQERVTKKIKHGLIERQRIREIEAEIGGRQYRRNGGGRRVVPA